MDPSEGHDSTGRSLDTLSSDLYPEMERRARALLRGRRMAADPETDSLVNRACVNLLKGRTPRFENRAQFLAFIAASLRNVLVDVARERSALARGGGRAPLAITKPGVEPVAPGRQETLVLDVQHKLEKLARHDPSLARLVELRFFGGLTWGEIAEVTGRLDAAIQKDWYFVRAWFRSELRDEQAETIA